MCTVAFAVSPVRVVRPVNEWCYFNRYDSSPLPQRADESIEITGSGIRARVYLYAIADTAPTLCPDDADAIQSILAAIAAAREACAKVADENPRADGASIAFAIRARK
jgi:hypothetical protein